MLLALVCTYHVDSMYGFSLVFWNSILTKNESKIVFERFVWTVRYKYIVFLIKYKYFINYEIISEIDNTVFAKIWRGDFFGYLTDFSYFFCEKKKPKVAEHSQNLTNQTFLKRRVDGFSVIFHWFSLILFSFQNNPWISII